MKRTITFKIILLYVSMLIIPVMLFARYSFNTNMQSVRHQIIDSTREMLVKINLLTEENINQMNGIVKTIYSRPLFEIIQDKKYDFTSYEQIEKRAKIEETLNHIMNQSEDMTGIYILTTTGNIFYDSDFSFKLHGKAWDTEWFRRIKAARGKPVIFGTHRPWMATGQSRLTRVFSIGMALYNLRGELLAVVISDIDTQMIYKNMNRLQNRFHSDLFLVDEQGNILASTVKSGTKYSTAGLADIFQKADRNEKIVIGNRPAYVSNVTSSITGWRIYSLTFEDVISGQLSGLRMSAALVFIFIICWFVAFLYIVYITVYRPLKSLSTAMKDVRMGKLDAYADIHRRDEIGELINNYNSMLLKINDLIYNQYQLELQRKDAEYEVLKGQINPHFIINSLQLISSIAVLNNDPEVDEMVKPLSHMLRYALYEKGHRVPLMKEISHVENYLQLQQRRREIPVSVNILVPEEHMGLMVMKLMLQPVVENCFSHGFKRYDGNYRITITSKKVKEKLLLAVGDNGCGMGPDTLHGLRVSLKNGIYETNTDRDGGIALGNIAKRIYNLFGKKARLRIFSRDGQGTLVIFTLPVR